MVLELDESGLTLPCGKEGCTYLMLVRRSFLCNGKMVCEDCYVKAEDLRMREFFGPIWKFPIINSYNCFLSVERTRNRGN